LTSAIVGIDLGTTNTVVAAVRDGQAIALADAEGHRLLPSVVSFHPNGSVLVGREAKARRRIDARNTVYSVKRLIGRSWSSPELTAARGRFAFDMREGPGNAALVVARGETYTLPEISAFVLRKAKQFAEEALGQPVERAVITVPANFNDLQRAATKVAGRVAGIEVHRILNEPTAAALAYGFGRGHTERIAVYDFGGGTLDITLLDLAGNVFEVLATAGNTFLGGDDIDVLIAERMGEACLRQHRYDPRSNRDSFEQLRATAEVLKVMLSTEAAATIDIPEFVPAPGGRMLTFSFGMTRAELNALMTPIVDQTFEVCNEALGVARLNPRDFQQVLLVGGSTRIPLVRERVKSFFGREPLANLNPDEVVAIGAAIQANALAAGQRRQSLVPDPPARLRRESAPSILPGGGARPVHLVTHPGLGSVPGTLPPLPVPPPAPATGQPPRPPLPTGPGPSPAVAPAARRPGPPPLGADESPLTRSPVLPVVTSAGLRPTSPQELPREPWRPRAELPRPAVEEAVELDEEDLEELEAQRATRRSDSTSPTGDDDSTDLDSIPDLDDEEEAPPTDPVPGVAPPPGPIEAPVSAIPRGRPSGPISVSPVSRAGVTSVVPITGLVGSAIALHEAPAVAVHSVRGADLRRLTDAPLLVDVTPLSLSVETVGGFCDAVIARNTPVPCERTRVFATAADQQVAVRVRVSQGESSRFADNTLLGEVELAGLRPAPRGKVRIEVTFVLDTDGILDVHAKDLQTGRATSARVRLVGLPENEDLAGLAARHAAPPAV